MQAVNGPKPTGLGVSVRIMLSAMEKYAPEGEVVGFRPNESGDPLTGVPDRMLWEQWRFPRRVAANRRRLGIDLMYSPALGAPMKAALPKLAHVHDLIPLKYPEQFTGWAGWYWKEHLPRSWKSCQRLTVSNETVKEDLVDLLQYPPARISVVPYYPDPELISLSKALPADFSTRQSDDAPYFLTVGSHEPRKNLALVIRALARLTGEHSAARLVCVGLRTGHTAELEALAAELGVADRVSFPGYLGRLETVRLLVRSAALVFVSRYEGYGMPPMEAQSIGCPVILSDIGCLRHIYGDASRLQDVPTELRSLPEFVGVDDDLALANEMQRLLEDADHLGKLRFCGTAYAGTFKPEDTATALRSAFQLALGS